MTTELSYPEWRTQAHKLTSIHPARINAGHWPRWFILGYSPRQAAKAAEIIFHNHGKSAKERMDDVKNKLTVVQTKTRRKK